MRNLSELERYRFTGASVVAYYGSAGDDSNGVFIVPSVLDNDPLRVIASIGFEWEHVSVSRVGRCPQWEEMEQIARLFFQDHETVMQLHVPPADHINAHPYCLHLWRPMLLPVPRPPSVLVG